MPEVGSNFISAAKLKKRLDDKEEWVIIDTRFSILQPQTGREAYIKGHLPGAVYMPLEYDFSDEVGEHGGRHPLPDQEKFSKRLQNLGIDFEKPVVIYEDTLPENAARLWWTFKHYYGYDNVFILDGGFQEWNRLGYPLDTHIPILSKTKAVVLKPDENNVCQTTELLEMINKKQEFALIDARAPERFLGQEELIDPVAGHIPGAINFFWESGFDTEGKILEVDELINCMSDLAHYDDIVVYCGSGVTACATILTMDESGISNARLYPGGWSDWITYPEFPKILP